jgi:hypothetical protein
VAVDERYALDVTLGTSEDGMSNAVVVSGVDLDVPLEADLISDPLHRDEVLLEASDGTIRVLTVDDPDVRLDLDKKLYFYRFRNIPPGVYSLYVRNSVQGGWASIATALRIDRKGVSFGGKQLTDAPPPAIPPEQPEAGDPGADEPAEAKPADTSDELPDDNGW